MSNYSRLRMTFVGVCLAASVVGGVGKAIAVEAAGADDPGASFKLGSQVQQGGGYTVYGGVDFNASRATTWSLEAHHDRASSEIPQTSLTGLTTTGITAGVRHDFSASGIELSLSGWQDPTAVRAAEALGVLRLGGDALNLGIELEGRHSSFEPFMVNTAVRLPKGVLQPVNAIANCSLNNTGYGLRLAFDQNGWSGNLNGMKYAYSSTDCRFNAPGLQTLRKNKPEQFRQLAPALTRRFSRSAASKLTSKDSFLDYDFSGGLSYKRSPVTFGIDLDHAVDQFDDLVTNSVTGTLAFDLGSAYQLAFEAGVSKSNAFGSLPFAGISVTRTL